MIRTVLVATDGSDAAMAAVRTAVDLTLSLKDGAALHVVSVVAYADLPSILTKQPPGAPDLLTYDANEAIRDAVTAAGSCGIEATVHMPETGDVVSAILDCAAEIGADVIVAGFHGKNRFVRMVMGSVAGRLVRSTELPVLVVRSGADRGEGC